MVTEVIVPLNAVGDVGPERHPAQRWTSEQRAPCPRISATTTSRCERGDGLTLRGGARRRLSSAWVRSFPASQESAEKPDGDIEIRRGENVMIGHGGEKLGTVQDVLFDDGELVGIVVRANGFFAHDVVVQVRFLDRSDDLALFLRMTPEDVRQLSELRPSP